jgi:hypothetical protein
MLHKNGVSPGVTTLFDGMNRIRASLGSTNKAFAVVYDIEIFCQVTV